MLLDLTTNLGRISLKNPVLVASGTFGYGEEYAELIDLNQLGGIITKSVTLKPREGSFPPRLTETPAGMLNAIGLENPGVELFLKEKLPFLSQFDTKIIVNIAGEKEDEFCQVAEKLSKAKTIDALEVNLSCPNLRRGGYILGKDPEVVFSLIHTLKRVTDLPLLAKLTAAVSEPTEIARAAEEAGAEALSLINTLPGMAINIQTRRPRLGNITGGLSGPAIRPIAVRVVWEVARAVRIPILGMGGIMKGDDALEFILAGASAVAVGTASFVDPTTPGQTIKQIEDYLKKNKIWRFRDLIGKVETQSLGRKP